MSGNESILSRHVEPGEPFDELLYAFRLGQSLRAGAARDFRHACEHGSGNAEIRRKVTCAAGARRKASGDRHENNLCLNGEGLAGLERDAIVLAVRQARGDKTRAAQKLLITRSTLQSKIAKHDLKGVLLLNR